MKAVNIGVCGLGTVGGGTVNVLKRNRKEIERRIGLPVNVIKIGARRNNPACDTADIKMTDDIFAVARDPAVDILVEVIGGTDIARELVLEAIHHGKHVVTANKALIATHGNEIFRAAQAAGVTVAYEAAVAGGIPIMKALSEGLAANRIQWLAGIINGTGNFILTEMWQKGREFAEVLAEAQALGYAEADPTFDVEGVDAAHKLAIMAANAFGVPMQFEQVYVEGISNITPVDIQYAEELGYRIKHLGFARNTEQGLELRVHPTLIPADKLLAQVNGVMNGVMVSADAVGPTLYYGAGAGAEATASAVIADIIAIARQQGQVGHGHSQAFAPEGIRNIDVLPIEKVETAFYLRMSVVDHPGVMSAITHTLCQHDINIEAVVQKEVREGQSMASIIMLTHEVAEAKMNKAIEVIEALSEVEQPVVRIRADHLNCD